MADIIQTFPKGSGSGGGHTILDTDGTAVAQETKLQFKGAAVTDNSTDGVTEVEGEGLNSDSIDDIAGAQTLVPAVIIGDSNNYSTTEKVIGKWIDGKPLYQKTFTVTRAANVGNTSITHGLSFDYITVADAVIIGDDKSLAFPLPNNWVSTDGTDGAEQSEIVITSTIISIRIRNNEMTIPSTIYITLKYTKTTD